MALKIKDYMRYSWNFHNRDINQETPNRRRKTGSWDIKGLESQPESPRTGRSQSKCQSISPKPVTPKPITPKPGTSQSSAPVETPKSTKRKFKFQPLSPSKCLRFQLETPSKNTKVFDVTTLAITAFYS